MKPLKPQEEKFRERGRLLYRHHISQIIDLLHRQVSFAQSTAL
ncbi:rCG55367 [Rattus norvegicus]|uniref:RCG55367 n=1 Tax=Rattus norvegicus TaxID=10116 RepID=A6JQK4_RAT|nr:rCG55367 [Rattus norvegicus]